MRKITTAIDDEIYLRACAAASERSTSVAAMVKAFLEEVGARRTDRLKCEEREIRSRIVSFTASDKLSREELHSRTKSPR